MRTQEEEEDKAAAAAVAAVAAKKQEDKKAAAAAVQEEEEKAAAAAAVALRKQEEKERAASAAVAAKAAAAAVQEEEEKAAAAAAAVAAKKQEEKRAAAAANRAAKKQEDGKKKAVAVAAAEKKNTAAAKKRAKAKAADQKKKPAHANAKVSLAKKPKRPHGDKAAPVEDNELQDLAEEIARIEQQEESDEGKSKRGIRLRWTGWDRFKKPFPKPQPAAPLIQSRHSAAFQSTDALFTGKRQETDATASPERRGPAVPRCVVPTLFAKGTNMDSPTQSSNFFLLCALEGGKAASSSKNPRVRS